MSEELATHSPDGFADGRGVERRAKELQRRTATLSHAQAKSQVWTVELAEEYEQAIRV